LDQLIGEAQDAAGELRDLAHGIYPPELTQHGLTHALRVAAVRAPLPTTVQAQQVGRYRADVEATVYFCCLEALQNAAKHAGPGATVSVTLDGRNDLRFEVRDTGRGIDPFEPPGQGLQNMHDRVGALGGTLTIATRPGTTITGTIPITRHWEAVGETEAS
jgi:signal transduction histidine kinase